MQCVLSLYLRNGGPIRLVAEPARLVSTAYGDGSPGITRRYTPDGLLASVSVGGTNASTWSYDYNSLRLLRQ